MSDFFALNSLRAQWGNPLSLVSWGSAPVCTSPYHSTWAGVTCSDGEVVALKLDHSSLKGNLPLQLGGLSGLTLLSLEHNLLQGSIPAAVLRNLTSLSVLKLHYNSLDGNLPSEVGFLTGLSSLSLYTNRISGTLPENLWGLKALTFLDLHGNKINGTISQQIGDFTSLVRLDLSYNMLSKDIPAQLGSCRSLVYLSLSANSLSGSIPPSLGLLTDLTALKLANNELVGAIPDSLCAISDVNPSAAISLFYNVGLTCYPLCLNSAKYLEVDTRVSACTTSPTSFPTALPTLFPTSFNTRVPLQWKYASFMVSQTFICVGAATACSSTDLYRSLIPTVNAKLWAAYADRQTTWLTEQTVVDSSDVTFNEVGVSGSGFLVSYTYTFKPVNFKMSSMSAVRQSFQRAVASNLVGYNDALQRQAEQLTCVSFDVSPANLALGVPTFFPTSPVFEPLLLNVGAQIILGAALSLAVVVTAAVWWLRSGVQRQCDQDEASEKIVNFQAYEFVLPLTVAITAAASNAVQVYKFYNDPKTVVLAAVMMASRFSAAAYAMVLIWAMLKRKSLRHRLAATLLDNSLFVWLLIGFVTMLDPINLRFFPWRRAPFAIRSRGFPTKVIFKLCNLATACNALVQFCVSAFARASFSSIASLVLSLLLFVSTLFTVSVRMTAEKVRARSRLAETLAAKSSPPVSPTPTPSPLTTRDVALTGEQRDAQLDLESALQKIADLSLALDRVQAEYAEYRPSPPPLDADSSQPISAPRRLILPRPTVSFDSIYNPAIASAAAPSASSTMSVTRSARDSEVVMYNNEIHDVIPRSNNE